MANSTGDGAFLADPALREKHPDMVSSQEEEALRVMADRLMHLAARMAALGYDPPGLDPAREILKRHGLPSTLEEWRERAEVDNPPEYGDDEESGSRA